MYIPELIFWIGGSVLGLFYIGYYSLCIYINKHRGFGVDKDRDFRPKVSMVIATWNEEDSIGGKLENTLKLDYPKNKLEILVVDSGSTDRTRDMVKKFIRKSRRIKLVTQKKRRGKSCALNKAFKFATGDIVVISDADCRLKKDILLKSMPYFSDDTVGALTGRESIINSGENLATRTEKTYRNFYYLIRGAESRLNSTYVFDGPFAAFRKNLLTKLDNSIVADDSQLALNIKKQGYRTISIPEAIYYEYAPSKLSDRTKQKSRRAEGLTQSLMGSISTFMFRREYGLFGMFIFPAGIFMHIVSPFILLVTIITFLLLPIELLAILIPLLAVTLLIPRTRRFLLTFLHSQYSLLIGVLKHLLAKPDYSWKKIENTRRYKKC